MLLSKHTKRLYLGVLAGAVFALPHQAQALPGHMDTFNGQYGTAGTDLDSCGMCHLDFRGGGTRNPYGAAVEANTAGTGISTDDLVAVEGLFSDGDAVDNGGEIGTGFFPGWDCDTFTTALGVPPANFADLVDPDNPGCGGVVPLSVIHI